MNRQEAFSIYARVRMAIKALEGHGNRCSIEDFVAVQSAKKELGELNSMLRRELGLDDSAPTESASS